MPSNPRTLIDQSIDYERGHLKTGIMHFGVGGFHRAHQAMYIDRLLRQGKASEWAICGVGVMPADAQMRDALTGQDMSYMLLTRTPDGTEKGKRIGSIVDYLFAPEDPQAVIDRIGSPETKIITLTVTEGGYNIHETTGEFMLDTPGVAKDLNGQELPETTYGLIVAGLRKRRDDNQGGLTILSCDNLQHNGRIAKKAIVSFARAKDPELANWIEDNVSFPSSMVDRITPVTTSREIDHVNRELGIKDAWPVAAEDFVQWVVDDDFVAGRPPFEDAGVTMVDDVTPYELMKLRLLNASHQALAYLGHLAGHKYAHDAVRDPEIRDYLKEYMLQARQTLAPVPGVQLDEYCETLLDRFGNEAIADTLTRLGTDGSDRIGKFVLPVATDLIAQGKDASYAAGIVAAWALVTELVRTGGIEALADDRQADEIERTFAAAGGDATKMIQSPVIFGELADSPEFAAQVAAQYEALKRQFG